MNFKSVLVHSVDRGTVYYLCEHVCNVCNQTWYHPFGKGTPEGLKGTRDPFHTCSGGARAFHNLSEYQYSISHSKNYFN